MPPPKAHASRSACSRSIPRRSANGTRTACPQVNPWSKSAAAASTTSGMTDSESAIRRVDRIAPDGGTPRAPLPCWAGDHAMPWKTTTDRAKKDLAEGKRPTTAAGEFVKEEMEHIRRGKHGARSTKQAIAIGLSKARREGIPLKPPQQGKTSASTRRKAEQDYEVGQHKRKPRASSRRRSRVREEVMKREPRSAAS